MTLQNAPPGLDYDRDKRFSKVVLVLSANSWLASLCFMSVSACFSLNVYLLMKAFQL